MKRTIPLLITAIVGFVLIISSFIPATEDWGEVAAIWFDVLASVAFVLGGGNLLKVHLKKISDQTAGWGYSAVTLIAFLGTLYVGLVKWGSVPAPNQEFYGESFATIELDELPPALTFNTPGTIPTRGDGTGLPLSARSQIRQAGENISFTGWMQPNQQQDLSDYKDVLAWKCAVFQLAEAARPPESLRGKVNYYVNHRALSFRGVMRDEDRAALLAIDDTRVWGDAVDKLYELSRREVSVELEIAATSDGIAIPASLEDRIELERGVLRATGPLSRSDRQALTRVRPVARPMTPEQQASLRAEVEAAGTRFTARQLSAWDVAVMNSWTPEQLRSELNKPTAAKPIAKSPCDLVAEQSSGNTELEASVPGTPGEPINDGQFAVLEQFAGSDTMTPDVLVRQLSATGPFTEAQAAALSDFLSRQPTVAERNRDLGIALLSADKLTSEQQDVLFDGYRNQQAWVSAVNQLFVRSHLTKYPWSGEYRGQGTPFWWLYEYAFKPLTATMFAMLAFYVASAAFRAFRAKNLEAILLLGTAFIILLGRTFAGVLLTSFLPPTWFLRIENLTVEIMKVFNTAGNRAIMIGIALGIASTSLKVLLGVDRSYLGTDD